MHDDIWTFTSMDAKNNSPAFHNWGLKSIHQSPNIHTYFWDHRHEIVKRKHGAYLFCSSPPHTYTHIHTHTHTQVRQVRQVRTGENRWDRWEQVRQVRQVRTGETGETGENRWDRWDRWEQVRKVRTGENRWDRWECTGKIQCQVLNTWPILSWIKKFLEQQSKIWDDRSVKKLFGWPLDNL